MVMLPCLSNTLRVLRTAASTSVPLHSNDHVNDYPPPGPMPRRLSASLNRPATHVRQCRDAMLSAMLQHRHLLVLAQLQGPQLCPTPVVAC